MQTRLILYSAQVFGKEKVDGFHYLWGTAVLCANVRVGLGNASYLRSIDSSLKFMIIMIMVDRLLILHSS